MELNEAAQRILVRHVWLILILVCAGGAGAFRLHQDEGPKYRATARITLDADNPKSQSESAALADTARAIVTGPAQVSAALAKIGVRRDALALARHDIGVEALGSSGILSLSVIDRDPRVAAALANTLADALISARVQTAAAGINALVADIESQIHGLDEQIEQTDRRMEAITARIASGGSPQALAALDAQRSTLGQKRDELAQERTALSTQLVDLRAQDALRPAALVLDKAVTPVRPLPSRRLLDVALGMLLGLILGVAAASIIEAFRPTIVGRSAFMRELGVPVIRELNRPPLELDELGLSALAARLEMAALGAGVERIELIPVEMVDGYEGLKRYLSITVMPNGHGDVPGTPSSQLALRQAQPSDFNPYNGHQPADRATALSLGVPAGPRSLAPPPARPNGSIGAVLVSPDAIRKSALDHVWDLLAVTHWPLVGVVTYRRGSSRARYQVAPSYVSLRQRPS